MLSRGEEVSSYLGALRLFGRDVRLYLVTAAVIGFTLFGGVNAVLANLYVLRLGHQADAVGLIAAAGMFALALTSLPAGALGGRWGTRSAMLLGLALASLGTALFPVAELVPGALQLAWLVGANVVTTVGVSLYIVNANPFLMRATGPAERQHVYAIQAALWPLAGFAGSLIGGALPGLIGWLLALPLTDPAPYRYPLLFTAALLALAALAISAAREPSAAPGDGRSAVGGAAPVATIAVLSVVVMLQGTGEAAVRTFFNVYLDSALGIATDRIGLLSAGGQLIAAAAALTTPLLVARLGGGRTYALGSAALVLSLMPLALFPHWGAAGLGFMGVIVAASVTRPAMMVYQMEMVAPRWRGAMSGAGGTAVGLSWAATGIGGGQIATAFGFPSLYLAVAASTAAGVGLFWLYFRTPRGEHARPAAGAAVEPG